MDATAELTQPSSPAAVAPPATAATDRLVALILEYDGARYRGFQLQSPGIPTIQGAVEEALLKMTGQSIRVSAAGRTDAGASAQGQVISFRPPTEFPLDRYVTGLNFYLPNDISVTRAQTAPLSFDVTRHARSRHYRYTILNRSTPSALLRDRAAHVRDRLDATAMAEAIQTLSGWMDARPFTGPLPPDRNPLRRYDSATVMQDADIITCDFEGSGFLPHQIRRVVGALVRVGAGQITVGEFHRLAREGEPGEATWTMSSVGLCLMGVRYDEALLSD